MRANLSFSDVATMPATCLKAMELPPLTSSPAAPAAGVPRSTSALLVPLLLLVASPAASFQLLLFPDEVDSTMKKSPARSMTWRRCTAAYSAAAVLSRSAFMDW